MFSKKFKPASLMVLPLAALLALTSCDEDEASVPTPAPVDISETKDLFSAPVQPNPLATDPSVVIVRVNGEDITHGDIQDATRMLIQQEMQRFYMRASQSGSQISQQQMEQLQGQLANNPKVAEEAKNMLIDQNLMVAAIAAANIEVSEEDFNAALEEDRARIPEGQDLDSALEAQGVTMEQYTSQLKKRLEANEYIDLITDNVAEATEEEAKAFYDENQEGFKKPATATASHILISFDPLSTNEVEVAETKAQKKAQIEKIRADILAGTITFEDAAKQYSSCPSGAEGGSLGSFGKGSMVPEFEEASFTQEIGEIGEPVETQFGYHIIKATERSEAGVISFEEAKERLLPMLTNQNKQSAVSDFIKGLRDSATIEMVATP